MGERIARIRCAGCNRSGLVSWAEADSKVSAPLHLSRGFKCGDGERDAPVLVCEACGRAPEIVAFA